MCQWLEALTALEVKAPGWHSGGWGSGCVGRQGDGELDGVRELDFCPIAREEVDADCNDGHQLQPGAVGCGREKSTTEAAWTSRDGPRHSKEHSRGGKVVNQMVCSLHPNGQWWAVPKATI